MYIEFLMLDCEDREKNGCGNREKDGWTMHSVQEINVVLCVLRFDLNSFWHSCKGGLLK